VIVVDGAIHSQKDGEEGNGGSLKDSAEAFVLFLHGTCWLVLRSSVFSLLDIVRWLSRWRMLRYLGQCCLGKVNLLNAGGAAEMLLVSLSFPLPLLAKNPPPLIASLLLFFLEELGATSKASKRLKLNLFLSGTRGGNSHFVIIV
jgi:hypothetical protein